jgi:hypothetical protein
MDEAPSDRLVEQRLRNRMMEALLSLVEWERDLRDWGGCEYFESFFDFFPYDRGLQANSSMTAEEQAACSDVHALMVAACNATPRMVTAEQLIAAGWPQRIAPVAHRALKMMVERGRFSEEREEMMPSTPAART